MTLWHDLLGNFAVVAICISLWTFSSSWLARRQKHLPKVAFNVLMTVGTLLVMMMPFEFQTGVYLDSALHFIALSGVFRRSAGSGCVHAGSNLSPHLHRWHRYLGRPVSYPVDDRLRPPCQGLGSQACFVKLHLGVLAASITLCSTIGFFFVVPASPLEPCPWPDHFAVRGCAERIYPYRRRRRHPGAAAPGGGKLRTRPTGLLLRRCLTALTPRTAMAASLRPIRQPPN